MMLKMKREMKTGDGGDEAAEDDPLDPQQQRRGLGAAPPAPVSGGLSESPRADVRPPPLDKESVFEWFGLHLNPAKRIEFMCGLLHMCQPLELRFLGSYLEDLARKDYHVLRDFEFRANSPGDLGALTDVVDPVVRSKLLVCLSLLGSDSRECAGILFRILSHVDPAVFYSQPLRPPGRDANGPGSPERTCGFSADEEPAGPLEQLALLFAMASLHPAFHFHQREMVRGQLDKIELAIGEESRLSGPPVAAHRPEQPGQKVEGLGGRAASHQPCQSRRSSRWAAQREAVHIKGIVLKGISGTTVDKQYDFEVKWSDSSCSSVTKSHLELENFLLKLPKDKCSESFEKGILRLLNLGGHTDSREVETHLREQFLSAPPVFRQTRKVCSFFNGDSGHSSNPPRCRCNCQLAKAHQGGCSDASSQEEDMESYAQGHKKKLGTKSPCQSLTAARGPQGDSRRGGHAADLRRKSCPLRSSQEAEQQQAAEGRSHPSTKTKGRAPPTDRWVSRDEVKGAASGRLALAQRRDPDTFGETSSESSSSPSSPHHPPAESLESEEDHNRDTDSHSDDSSSALGPDMFFAPQTNPTVGGVSVHQACPEAGTVLPPVSVMPFPLHGAADPPLPLAPPPTQSIGPDGKPSPGTLMVPPAVQGPGKDPEKRDILPTFGIPPVAPPISGSPTMHPVVQRFKTAVPHSPGGSDAAPNPSQQAPVRAMGLLPPGPTSFSSPVHPSQPSQDPGPPPLPHGEPLPAKHPSLTLPSCLPSPYTAPPSLTAGVPAATGHVQAALPPAVPTHTPGPAPIPSPAPTRSTAHGDCTSYSNSSASCGTPLAFQQTQQQHLPPQQPTPPQQQQQQAMCCGTCGCHNNCGGGRGGSGSSAPLFFSHQMAAARQVFSVPPPLFQLTSLCSNSFLTQAPHQANGGAALPPFYPTAAPPAHPSPYGPLHSHADLPSHMLGTQAAVAAANYSLQQQMAPAASFCQRVYQHVYPNPLGMLAGGALGGGGVNKKSGNVSCYNCGLSGHYAQDCNQPSIDSTQQGGAATRNRDKQRTP